MPGDRPPVTGNSFLDSLPDATRVRLQPLLSLQSLKKRQVLAEPGVPVKNVYFPVHSMISTVTQTLEGSAVEVGLTGHEGMSPVTVAFGSLVSRHVTIVQVPNSAFGINAKAFMTELAADALLRARSLQFAEYCFAAATQFTACNGLHAIEERYARWILMTDDRVGLEEFNLTQEYSAQMLGVRRASVTNVARALSDEGLISYRRGVIRVTDRPGLEDAACECYSAVNGDLQRIMGYGARQLSVKQLT
jgi:CRP-like cAMP-binding protein